MPRLIIKQLERVDYEIYKRCFSGQQQQSNSTQVP